MVTRLTSGSSRLLVVRSASPRRVARRFVRTLVRRSRYSTFFPDDVHVRPPPA